MPHPCYTIRKSIYGSLNARKGNLMTLKKSNGLKRDEKEKLQEVIEKMEELRVMYKNNSKPYSDNY